MRKEIYFMRGENTSGQISQYVWRPGSPWAVTRLGPDHQGWSPLCIREKGTRSVPQRTPHLQDSLKLRGVARRSPWPGAVHPTHTLSSSGFRFHVEKTESYLYA